MVRVLPEEQLRDMVARHGWAVRQVFAEPETSSPCFSYTIGLTSMAHPEVIVVGMPFEPAHAFLTDLVGLIRGGRRFEPGTRTDELTDPPAPVEFVRVDDVSPLSAAIGLHGRIEAVQLVWPDTCGRLPWEPEFANPPGSQPVLGDRGPAQLG